MCFYSQLHALRVLQVSHADKISEKRPCIKNNTLYLYQNRRNHKQFNTKEAKKKNRCMDSVDEGEDKTFVSEDRQIML